MTAVSTRHALIPRRVNSHSDCAPKPQYRSSFPVHLKNHNTSKLLFWSTPTRHTEQSLTRLVRRGWLSYCRLVQPADPHSLCRTLQACKISVQLDLCTRILMALCPYYAPPIVVQQDSLTQGIRRPLSSLPACVFEIPIYHSLQQCHSLSILPRKHSAMHLGPYPAAGSSCVALRLITCRGKIYMACIFSGAHTTPTPAANPSASGGCSLASPSRVDSSRALRSCHPAANHDEETGIAAHHTSDTTVSPAIHALCCAQLGRHEPSGKPACAQSWHSLGSGAAPGLPAWRRGGCTTCMPCCGRSPHDQWRKVLGGECSSQLRDYAGVCMLQGIISRSGYAHAGTVNQLRPLYIKS